MPSLLLLLACGGAEAPPAPVPDSEPVQEAPPTAEHADHEAPEGEVPIEDLHGYDREVRVIELRRRVIGKRLAARKDDPARKVAYANALLDLQRLTGDLNLIEAAQRLADEAAEVQPETPRVKTLQATLLAKRHRFGDALAIYETLPKSRSNRIAIANTRFEMGEYEPALAELRAIAAEERPDPHLLASIAIREGKLGRFDVADATMAEAAKHYHNKVERWPVAWQHLMLGLMDLDRGRYEEAQAHYLDARKEVLGWWLVDEHLAEIDLLLGMPNKAIRAYEKVVAETGNPELIGALAEAYEAAGRAEEAEQTRARAQKAFDEQVARHGSLVSGHAIEFYIEYGDPKRALELATANAEMRPNGESKLLLADALEKNGDAAGAEKLRAEVKKSGWFVAD